MGRATQPAVHALLDGKLHDSIGYFGFAQAAVLFPLVVISRFDGLNAA